MAERAFKRFRIGTLPDGGDEWLEFWRHNHLLAPHAELAARAQVGLYGDRDLAFLSLPDLIRSKETERDKDWDDVTRLEEFADSRTVAALRRGEVDRPTALARLRSRAGFGTYVLDGTLAGTSAVALALAVAIDPITQAFLIPFAPDSPLSPDSIQPIEPIVLDRLRKLPGGSPLHLSLVEVVRRRYILFRKEADRRDKQTILANLPGPRA